MTRGGRRRRRGASRSQARNWRRRLVALLSLGALVVCAAGGTFWLWSRRGDTLGQPVDVHLATDATIEALSQQLQTAGVLESPWLFKLYLALTHAGPKLQRGRHLLRRGLAPAALAARLTRSPARPIVKFTIPEGYNRFQIAERLQTFDISLTDEFLTTSGDGQLLRALEVTGGSAEGYLFPATYELYVNSDPAVVLRTFVRETFRRFRLVSERHPQPLAEHRSGAAWGMHELLTLASIVEKEAADKAEHGNIASVFHNRLRDPNFRPRQMLQSDPTAGYGCLLDPQRLQSCHGYTGTVTRAMLRDAANPYNTYKHPGLPPGPISNPSQSAVEAVINPPQTPYFFFVAGKSKRHVFSRTFAEHEQAIVTGIDQPDGHSALDQIGP